MKTDPNDSNQEELELQDSPGAILKRQRELRGLSEREVAESLRLLPQQIGYLEADEFERFNGDIFCRAHLRAYAQLVGIDDRRLLELYQAITPAYTDDDDEAIRVNTGLGIQVQKPGRGHSLRYWGAGLAASLALVLWFSQPDDTGSPLVISEIVDPNDQSSLHALEQEESPGNTLLVGTASSDAFDAEEQESVVLDLPAGARPDASVVERGTAVTNSRAGADKLQFAFTEDCWVEVTDGNGAIIFAALKRAEDTLLLSGTGPFKVLLGYAHGVSLNYNGEPIEINVNNRNNSARLVVGNLPVR